MSAVDEDDDPALNQFLGHLANDIAKHPEQLQPIDSDLFQRLLSLVDDVEVDLDAALSSDDD